jgi:hypothetical protein
MPRAFKTLFAAIILALSFAAAVAVLSFAPLLTMEPLAKLFAISACDEAICIEQIW